MLHYPQSWCNVAPLPPSQQPSNPLLLQMFRNPCRSNNYITPYALLKAPSEWGVKRSIKLFSFSKLGFCYFLYSHSWLLKHSCIYYFLHLQEPHEGLLLYIDQFTTAYWFIVELKGTRSRTECFNLSSESVIPSSPGHQFEVQSLVWMEEMVRPAPQMAINIRRTSGLDTYVRSRVGTSIRCPT